MDGRNRGLLCVGSEVGALSSVELSARRFLPWLSEDLDAMIGGVSLVGVSVIRWLTLALRPLDAWLPGLTPSLRCVDLNESHTDVSKLFPDAFAAPSPMLPLSPRANLSVGNDRTSGAASAAACRKPLSSASGVLWRRKGELVRGGRVGVRCASAWWLLKASRAVKMLGLLVEELIGNALRRWCRGDGWCAMVKVSCSR